LVRKVFRKMSQSYQGLGIGLLCVGLLMTMNGLSDEGRAVGLICIAGSAYLLTQEKSCSKCNK